MRKRGKREYSSIKKVVFWSTTAILVFLTFLIIRPFLVALISAFVLAYLVKPIFNRLSSKLKKSYSAILSIIIIILVIVVPISLLIGTLLYQINYTEATELIIPEKLDAKIQKIPFLANLNIEALKEKGVDYALSIVSTTIAQIPFTVISLLIMIVAIYYILYYWKEITFELKELLPFKNKAKIEKEIADTTDKIIRGYLLLAMIEFVVASIGFYISGVKAYILLPMIIAILAFIPFLGAGIVWVPLSLYYISMSNYYTAIGVILTGLTVSFLVEEGVSAKIMQKKARLNPLVFLIGAIGGVPLFGVFGLVIGPLVLVYALKFLKEALVPP